MPIENTGPIRLRGAAGDGRTDINEEINGNVTDTDVSLGTLNTSAFTNVADGTTVSGRSMSEMRGYAAFESLFPSTEADGALGESLLFDGNNSQYASFTPSLTGNRRTWTMSFWVKINKNGTQETIISQGSTSISNVFVVRRESNNKFAIYIERSGGYSKATANSLIIDNSGWYNVVVAFDVTKTYSGDKVRIYINGIEEKDITYANSGGLFNDTDWAFNVASSAIRIGQYRYTNSDYLDGVIADFKFIDGKQLRPDSFGELVQGIWIPKAFNTASTDTLVTSNLVANYQLNGDAADETGSHNATSSSNITYYNNNYGIASFNGSNSTIIKRDIFSSSPTQCSLCVWAAATAWTPSSSNMTIAELGDPNTNIAQNRIFITTGGELYVSINGGDSGYASTNISNLINNTWHHIVATWDVSGGGVTNGIKLYIDGNLVHQGDSTASFNSLTDLAIGVNENTPDRHWFNGKIGEVQVYSDLLTAAEVLQNYNATKHKYTYGLNGFWLPLNNTSTGSIVDDSSLKLHLDASDSSSYSGSGTNWNDLSGNLANATLNGATFLSSTNGGVFDFDGSNDDATIDDTKVNYSNFSLEFWVNPDANLTSSNTLFSRYSTTASQNTWHIRGNDTNNGIEFIRYPSGVNGATLKDNSVVPINKWTHIVVTHDETSSILKIYKNGALDATRSFSGNLVTGSTTDLLIGNLQGYNFRYNGQLAQVRFYNDILTAQEIITNYRATQGNYEQVSTVDISGNANSFTATNIDATDHIKDEPLDNYATFDPNNKINGSATITLSEGNTKVSISSGSEMVKASIGVNSGKWYWEMNGTNLRNGTIGGRFGIVTAERGGQTNVENSDFHLFWHPQGNIYRIVNGSYVTPHIASGVQYYDNDVLAIALDADTQEIKWYKNNTLAYTYDYSSHVDSSVYLTAEAHNSSSGTPVYNYNFGQKPFTYDPPTGYLSLNTKNLSAPAFDPDGTTPDKPSNYFKAVTYQGTGGTQGEAYGYKEGSRAAVFNGSSSYISLPNIMNNITNTFSYSGWFKVNDTSDHFIAFFASTSPPTFTNSNAVNFTPVHSSGNYYFDFGDIFTSGQRLTGTTPDEWKTGWHHLAVSKSSSTITIYVDGTEFRTASSSGSVSITSAARLGNYTSNYANGWMDQVRIYNTALTQENVTTLYEEELDSNISISGLVAHYKLDGNALDETSNNYNGTASNVTYTQDKPYGNIDVGFAPDLVWIKSRSGAYNPVIFDSVRTVGGNKELTSTETYAEGGGNSSLYGYISTLDSNGFTLTAGSTNSLLTNNNGDTYVAWAWKAGGAAVSNTDGSITSTVSANPDAGFSIVSYTGTAVNATVGHGLSSAPEFWVVKNRDTTDLWTAGVASLGGGSYFDFNTDDKAYSSGTPWNSTLPTSNVVHLGNYTGTNGSNDMIMYCFHSVDGFSKIGSYTGNGSSDGPFIYTGFKPAWVMVKWTNDPNNSSSWAIYSNEINKDGEVNVRLLANSSAAEATSSTSDTYVRILEFYSNGFKVAGNSGLINENNGNYIYMAFAEDPVKYSNGVATLGDGNKFIQGGNYPEDNFNTTLYTGDGSTSLTVNGGFNFTPDAIWIKNRSAGSNHILQNTIVGINAPEYPDATYVGGANSVFGHVNSVSKGSFNVDDGGSTENNANYSGNNYVAWSWKAAGYANTYNILENGTVTSSASASTLGLDTGTITPSGVSANRDNGFSIVKYSGGNSSDAKVPHGLSKPPELIIVKNISDTASWPVLTKEGYTIDANTFTLSASSKYLALNSDAAYINYVFDQQLGGTANGGLLTDQLISYCWHSVSGFSKIGKYTGKGSTAAFSVYLGFEPAWVMIKRTDANNSWVILDSKRDNSLSTVSRVLWADLPDSEAEGGTTTSINIDSDGFSFTTSQYGASINTNGGEYIYMAFAHR